jgi:hypothetical protein
VDASNNAVGGTAAGAGNVISGNGGDGVFVGTGANGVPILGKSISANGALGIHLDAASNANDNQGAPVLTTVTDSATGTTITGTLAGYPNRTFRIEFFSNPSPDSSEGQTLLGSVLVPTDAQGNFTANLPAPLPAGTNLSATATVATPNGDGTYTYGDTSEFSVQAALPAAIDSSLMLAGANPPPLTGSVNGTPFTGTMNYTTASGDVVTVTLGTAATSASPVGQYAITASLSGARAAGYYVFLSAPATMYVVSLGADPSSTTGAQAITFWDNKGNKSLITAADLQSLVGLNLVNRDGTPFDPTAVGQLDAWLQKVNSSWASDPAYLLSAQLAVLDLNTLVGDVHPIDLVYAGGLLPYASTYGITGLTSGGFIDVQDLMNAANAVLAQVSPNNPAGAPNQAYETALAQVLQAANANADFVQQELIWNLLGF